MVGRERMQSVRDKLAMLLCVMLCALSGATRETWAQLTAGANVVVVDNALAQPITLSQRMPLTLESVRWGWTGTQLMGGVHNPVRITLSSGSNAVAGVVTLVYPQDASQSARASAPFSTTPNVGVTVELQVAPPIGTTQMRLEIIANGRAFVLPMDSPVATSLNDLAAPSVTHVRGWAVMGPDLTLNVTPTNPAQPATGTPGRTGYWDITPTPTIPAARFPGAWIGYESVDGVVARQRDVRQLSATQREALRTWLERGGRMVLVLDEAGDDWRDLLPAFMPDDLLEASEVRRVSVSPSVSEMLRATDASDPEEWTRRSQQASDRMTPAIRSRLLTLSENAQALGWELTLTVDERSETKADWDRTGIAAAGPVGLGMLGIVGTDPANLPEQVNARETMAAWRWLMDQVRDLNKRTVDRYNWWDAGSDEGQRISAAADSIVLARTPGVGFFVIVMTAVLLLALWVGPAGRAYFKRRRLLSRSWAIALASIAVCTLIGLLAPRLFREGTSDVGTLTLHDVYVDAEGRPIRVYTSRLVSVFAGAAGRFDVSEVEVGREDPRGQWWRGVSPVQASWNVSLKPGATVTLANTPAALGTMAAGVLEPVDAAQWTLRMFMGVYPGSGPGEMQVPRVRVRRERAGESADQSADEGRAALHVEVNASDELGLVRDCTLRHKGGYTGVSLLSTRGQTRVHRFFASDAEISAATGDTLLESSLEQEAICDIGLSASATQVIGRLTQSGEYAVVKLSARVQRSGEERRTLERTVYRIIAPVLAQDGATEETR